MSERKLHCQAPKRKQPYKDNGPPTKKASGNILTPVSKALLNQYVYNKISRRDLLKIQFPHVHRAMDVTYAKLAALDYQISSLESILFILNITKNPEQKTIVGSPTKCGSHWSILKFELASGEYVYLDSLGWTPPTNIKKAIGPIIQAIGKISNTALALPHKVSQAHNVNCNRNRSTCTTTCLTNYPLQQCGEICGPITILMASLYVGAPKDWNDFIKLSKEPTDERLAWLKHPSDNSAYIRQVLASWFVNKRANLANIGIIHGGREDLDEIENKETGEKQNTNRQEIIIDNSPTSQRIDVLILSDDEEMLSEDGLDMLGKEIEKDEGDFQPENDNQEVAKEIVKMKTVNVAVNKKHRKQNKQNEKSRQCEYCKGNFSSAHMLRKHKKRKHPNELSEETNQKNLQSLSIKCSECKEFSCATRLELIDHFNTVHERGLQKEDREFKNIEEFEIWKKTMEKEGAAWFVRCRGTRTARDFETTWYICNREGAPRLGGTGKKAMKHQGTCKIKGHCTSYMKVVRYFDSECVVAQYCLGHTGHESYLGHLRIPNDIRTKIAGKLASGMKLEKILDEIREDTEHGITRGHLIERQDLMNIKHQYNIELMEKHKQDTVSVECWVEELKKCEFNPVLVYKPQGKTDFGLPANDFLLGIQTQYQLDRLKAHGSNIICMDATHSTNQYEFMLTTLLVVDEYGEGLPVAWLISNREDQLVLNPFIAAIKERTGELNVNVFMSDDANNFYNSWIYHFAAPKSKLICSWHVDRNWRKNLRKHVQRQEQQAEIYKALKTLQMELNENAFRKGIQQFSAWCEKKSPGFNDYFMDYYMHQPQQWASCFRIGKGINTNMVTEAFHNVLKGVYFQRRQNKRVDHLLCTLLKIARDKVFDGLIKAQKGKRTFKQRETDRRHKRAMEIDQNHITQIENGKWDVRSQEEKKKFYDVKRNKPDCSCQMQCSLCQVCQHLYTCSCTDFTIRSLACKHIHAVHAQIKVPEVSTTNKKEEEPIDYFETLLQNDAEYAEGQPEIENLKNNVMKKVEQLLSVAQSSQSCRALQACILHVNSVISVTQGLSSLDGEHSYFEIKQREDDETTNKNVNWVKCPLCGIWAHFSCDDGKNIDNYAYPELKSLFCVCPSTKIVVVVFWRFRFGCRGIFSFQDPLRISVQSYMKLSFVLNLGGVLRVMASFVMHQEENLTATRLLQQLKFDNTK
eukprot:gene6481-7221_t